MSLPAPFSRYRAAIDAELARALAGYDMPLYRMLRYHLGMADADGHPQPGGGGKALRPTLCLLASEALAGAYQHALPAAAALELLHNFTLIHDDIQDDDRERRHRPTVWSIWGKPQGINAGTAMCVIANLTMLHVADYGIPTDKQLHALRMLEEACLRVIEGQYLDISFERRCGVSVADYLCMIDRKTAALIACSLEEGALLSTDDERTIHTFRDFGNHLGLAFQMRDDILGIWGDEHTTGKPVGSDIQHRKKTLPIVYAWENAAPAVRDTLAAIYQQEEIDIPARDTVLSILDAMQARRYARRMAARHCDKAMAALAELKLPPWACAQFEELVAFLAQREF